MIEWLSSHAADIVITAILVIIFAAVIRKMIRDRRSGRSSCGCDCGCCGNAPLCKTKKKDRK